MTPDTDLSRAVLVRFDALGRILAPFTPEPLPMSFKLEIKTDNAAFHEHDDAMGDTLAQILEHIAGQLREGYTSNPALTDPNGNRVGAWSIDQ